MKKQIYKILIAIIFAIVIFILLFKTIMFQDQNQKVEFVEVVQVTNDLKESDKITEKDLTYIEIPKDLASNFIKDKTLLINKYANNDLFAGNFLMEKNIKESVIKEGEKEVRIAANLLTAGGLCKGDKVDLIYVNSIDSKIYGKEIARGLEVQAILNLNGTDLEKVAPDEYNSGILDPAYVVFYVDSEKAMDIATLQGTVPNIVFDLNKWNGDKQSNIIPNTRSINDILFINKTENNLYDAGAGRGGN